MSKHIKNNWKEVQVNETEGGMGQTTMGRFLQRLRSMN